MTDIVFRQVSAQDIIHLAEIRALNSGTREYWHNRIDNYYRGLAHPHQALEPRILYLASYKDKITGFIAGHLTQRYECDGELQWIDTIEEFRNRGIASQLIRILAKWFIDHKAYNICVDPGSEISRKLYLKNGAKNLNKHWMFWKDIREIL